jgi:hypothetical protein
MLVEEMKRKNEEAVMVDMEWNHSDEEDDVVLAEWSQTIFSEYSRAQALGNEWEYRESEVTGFQI